MLATLQRKWTKPFLTLCRQMHSEYVNINDKNGSREITLSHQKTKNSLSLEMMNNLVEAINLEKDDISLRAIILSAKGNVFSAGHNLKHLVSRFAMRPQTTNKNARKLSTRGLICTGYDQSYAVHNEYRIATCGTSIMYNNEVATFKTTTKKEAVHKLSDFFQHSGGFEHQKEVFAKATELMKSIVLCPVPVIAKVNGLAAAAGCQLVATCDMIVCTETSKFSTPGANFGVFCSTPGIALGRCIPKSRATYMLYTGDPLSAQEAYDSGLVTKVVSSNKLDEEVCQIVDKIKLKSRSVVALGKEFFYKQMELGLFDAYKLGADIMVENINTIDGQEGIRSFVEKRKASWSHK